MAQLDTLEVFENLVQGGFTREQALAQVKSFDKGFDKILRDFASNKLISGLGVIIIVIGGAITTIGGFTLSKIWDVSHDMVEVKSRLGNVENRLSNVETNLISKDK